LRVRAGPAKGLVFELNPRWEHTAWEGNYECDVQQQFVKFAKLGTIVYDIGANYGFFCLLGARIGAELIAFEPESENAAALARHARLNGLQDRIRIVPKAVFSYTGEVVLEPPAQSGAHGNARANPESMLPMTVRVPCTTLDDFTALNPAPGLVKMDVEGGESDVLTGADRTFRVFRPVLLCEIHDGENARFAQEWLRERDYDCLWLEDEARFPKHLLASPRERIL
jgi:FkbM family methyltransferase